MNLIKHHNINSKTQKLLKGLIGILDEKINKQVNSILHLPAVQKLESSWRGLKWLVHSAGKEQKVKIRLLYLSEKELSKDLLSVNEFDQSQLFKKIYSDELDKPGGEPFGLLIGDYAFSHKSSQYFSDGISLLSQLAKIAAAAFAPFISSIDPQFFDIDAFKDLKTTFQLREHMSTAAYTRWHALQQNEDSRFLGLTLPRLLMRVPYNLHHATLHRHFKESIHQHEDYLWGNCCYAYGCAAINSFLQTGWFADTKGINRIDLGGGVVCSPQEYFNTESISYAAKTTTEFMITDSLEKQLDDMGFIALKYNRFIGRSIFYSSQSIQKSKRYDSSAATSNAYISSMLHYLLCVSRFAHYVKIMMRNKIGSFINADECERFLQNWLQSYSSHNANASVSTQARYPLSGAKVKVEAAASQPGKYICTMHLQPLYQLDSIQANLKLVTQLKAQ